jgi:hypothetical protein
MDQEEGGRGNGGQVGATADPFRGSAVPGPPTTAPQAARAARMIGSRTREVPREVLRSIVLQYIATRVGVDYVDLASRADVHYFDANDKDVPLDSVVVTWED